MVKKAPFPVVRNMPEYVYIVPVGEQSEPVIEGFRHVKDIGRAYLLCTNKTRLNADKIKEKIAPLFPRCEVVETSADNLDKVISDVLAIMSENRDMMKKANTHRVLIANITGGTKMMSIGCYLAGLFFAERVLYIFKEATGSMRALDVPLVKVELNELTKKKDIKLRILNHLLEKETNLEILAQRFKLTKPTVWAHLKALEDKHLIEKKVTGRNVNYTITTTGRLLLNVEGIKNG
ncbi:MAG: DUF6293 family protein, partial [Nanoarchaeota archaeon]|nr:DUF6293 family protein [Nanoarchaeota archaeon]